MTSDGLIEDVDFFVHNRKQRCVSTAMQFAEAHILSHLIVRAVLFTI